MMSGFDYQQAISGDFASYSVVFVGLFMNTVTEMKHLLKPQEGEDQSWANRQAANPLAVSNKRAQKRLPL